jgi:murein DD-endopeptidase MepM/ murein hydrolase activator NlpD
VGRDGDALKNRITCFALLLSILGMSGCSSLPKDPNPRKGLLEVLGDYRATHGRPKKPRSDLLSRVELGSAKDSPQVAPRVPSGQRPSGSTRRLSQLTQGWQWPLKDVQLTSVFGKRGRSHHEGVDLRARVGTPVYSAHSGEVVYADDQISGYGKMVIMREKNGLFSLYAHCSRLKVSTGDAVKRGQLIALSGNTGSSTGPHLHFEVRSGVVAVNPESVFPPLGRKALSLVRRN